MSSTETSGAINAPRIDAGSAAVAGSPEEPCDLLRGFFRTGELLKAYRREHLCFLCGKMRRLFAERDGAEICFEEFETAGFQWERAVGS